MKHGENSKHGENRGEHRFPGRMGERYTRFIQPITSMYSRPVLSEQPLDKDHNPKLKEDLPSMLCGRQHDGIIRVVFKILKGDY